MPTLQLATGILNVGTDNNNVTKYLKELNIMHCTTLPLFILNQSKVNVWWHNLNFS